MKIILLADIYKQGVAGEVIEVADGFARNFLIPQGMAAKATPGELRKAASLRDKAAARRMQYEGMLNDLARQIDGVELIFGRRAASTGTLFGSVTTQQIAEALLEKTGVDINRRRISQQSLREIGTHEVPVRLGSENPPVLQVTVVREEDLAEFLAKREAGEEVEVETASGEAEEFVADADAFAEAEVIETAEAELESDSEFEVEADEVDDGAFNPQAEVE